MILTNCAACAAPLAHDAPRCVRCKTRYCNSTCQHDHWRRGHKQICKKIHRGGNAEQYHADQKYKEAVKVAVAGEACDDDVRLLQCHDTKGQTCYICTEGVKRRTGEGVVRGFCRCSGETSVAHVSCLVRQAEILVGEGVENKLGGATMDSRWKLWSECSLCEKKYRGFVSCALGWACWRTYCNRPERDVARQMSMKNVGPGLNSAGRYELALSANYAALAAFERISPDGELILTIREDIAFSLDRLGRTEEASIVRRAVYQARVGSLDGTRDTLSAAARLSSNLIETHSHGIALEFLPEKISTAKRVLGCNHETTLRLEKHYAMALFLVDTIIDPSKTWEEEKVEAFHLMEKVYRLMREHLGASHVLTRSCVGLIKDNRLLLEGRGLDVAVVTRGKSSTKLALDLGDQASSDDAT